MTDLAWFAGWLLAVAALFHAGVTLPGALAALPHRGARRVLAGAATIAAVAFVVLAGAALGRIERQFDLTIARTFTPDPAALAVAAGVDRPVQLTYFYRGDDPVGVRAKRVIERMGASNAHLTVTTVDPDADPALAFGAGVQQHNVALLEADGRRLLVPGTNEADIALGLQRILRRHTITACFMTGHGEYPSDNEEFHTHVEVLGLGDAGHDHGADAVVETTGHGVGRWRRALEALGHVARDITPAADGVVDPDCTLVIDAGPRTPYTAVETSAFETYLEGGGAALLLYDPGLDVSAVQRRWLRRLGVVLDDRFLTDPVQHYAGDPTMVAATAYPAHAITAQLSFAFFPGVRPLEVVAPAPGIVVAPILETSRHALAQPRGGHGHAHAETGDARARVFGVAIEGTNGDSPAATPFRVVIVGDSDFATNSFFPYMSNNRLALALVRWLVREEHAVPVAARIPVVATLEITADERRRLFAGLVVTLPFTIAVCGFVVAWRRR